MEQFLYHIQYEEFLVALENTQKDLVFEVDKLDANIDALEKQIEELERKITGADLYKESIESGTNLVSAYPEYESLYLLYVSDLEMLENEYEARRSQIGSDHSDEDNKKALASLQLQYQKYGLLLESIRTGRSAFPENDASDQLRMYRDYAYELSLYEQRSAAALEVYEELLFEYPGEHNDVALSGYRYFLKSVVNGKDMFPDTADLDAYKSLYTQYHAEYGFLADTAKKQHKLMKHCAQIRLRPAQTSKMRWASNCRLKPQEMHTSVPPLRISRKGSL